MTALAERPLAPEAAPQIRQMLARGTLPGLGGQRVIPRGGKFLFNRERQTIGIGFRSWAIDITCGCERGRDSHRASSCVLIAEEYGVAKLRG